MAIGQIDIYIYPKDQAGSVRVDKQGVSPTVVTCAKDAWTKVATGVEWARIWIKKTNRVYFHTYRANSAAPPTTLADGIIFRKDDVIYNHMVSGP